MHNSTSSSGRRLAAAMLLGATSAAVAASAAHADGGVSKAKVGDVTDTGVVIMSDNPAKDTNLKTLLPGNGKTILAYCLQENVGLDTTQTYSEADWSDAKVGISKSNLQAIKWILNHSFPTVDTAALKKAAGITDPLTESEAVAGTQAAIWAFSGSSTLGAGEDDPQNGDPNIAKVYTYLHDNASSSGSDEPQPSLQLTPLVPDTAHHAGDKIGYKVVSSDTSDSFISFDFTANSVGAKLVDGDGKDIAKGATFKSGSTVYVQLPQTLSADGSVSISATGTVTIDAARVFLSDGSKASQNLILAQPVSVPVEQDATVGFKGTVITPPPSSSSSSTPPSSSPSSHPSTTPSSTPSSTHSTTSTTAAATTTTTTDNSGSGSTDLAHTGAGNAMALGGGALALVAAGGGMVLYTRRRGMGTHS
ncbi:hypothetical protein GCM10009839_34450 [Catenulispora yoronensis]|uniref:Thioester domain-containing protein n=1 Tax=Catenulispora yoronensis TaxID=450799 RepID=A0ABP5FPX1_9ACTN